MVAKPKPVPPPSKPATKPAPPPDPGPPAEAATVAEPTEEAPKPSSGGVGLVTLKGAHPARGGCHHYVTNQGPACSVDVAGETVDVPAGRFEVLSDREDYTAFDVAQHILGRLKKIAPTSVYEETI